MDKLGDLIMKGASMQNIIIIILVVVVIVMIYRNYRESKSHSSASAANGAAKPSADKLLDQLEQNGAIQRQGGDDAQPAAAQDEESEDS